jgi:hypothetical protein
MILLDFIVCQFSREFLIVHIESCITFEKEMQLYIFIT